jgi:hypothetical protein|tara:strand:+ start:2525 stop:2689 length:165 start_codon:yes stop_codon:yes gene_type:complete
MKINGIYHVFGLDDKAKKTIKDAKMSGYRNEKDVDKFIKDNPTLNLTKEQAECF